MREKINRFTYRGKTPEGNWVKGVPYCLDEKKGVFGIFTLTDADIELNKSATGTIQVVEPETIGQLLYSSKEGEIFEGDIVRYQDEDGDLFGDEGIVAVIRWGGTRKYDYPAFDLYTWDAKRNRWDTLDLEYNALTCGEIIDVLGNIHDNPELVFGKTNSTH